MYSCDAGNLNNMGLQNREVGNYITIYQGKFSQNVPEGVEGSVTRVNKNGKTVHEKYYDSFTGKLVGIKTQDGAYGKNWVFSFKDNEEVYNLQLGYSNNYAVSIIKMLPNIDLTQEMKVSPKSEEKDGKTQTSLFINQNGVAIKHAFTKDKPNGIPQWEQITVKGVPTWDNTKQMLFLENMVMTQIVPKLEGVPQQVSNTPHEPTADEQYDNFNAPAGDINPDDVLF